MSVIDNVPTLKLAAKLCPCEGEKEVSCCVDSEIDETVLTITHDKCGAELRFICVVEDEYRMLVKTKVN